MKAQPIIARSRARPSVIPVPLATYFLNSHSRHHCHVRSSTRILRNPIPIFSYHCRHNGSRYLLKWGKDMRVWEKGTWRYASTSAAPATRADITMPPLAHTTTTNTLRESSTCRGSIKLLTVPVERAPSLTTMVPTMKRNESLNPPLFTYAPNLSVSSRKDGQHIANYLWSAGHAYLAFYRSGISHVWQTFKHAKTLQAKAAMAMSRRKDADITDVLTRAEWQIVKRSRENAFRLPAMGILILLLGEFLPLVALYVTPLLPETCRIPQQVKRETSKKENRRKDRLRRLGKDTTGLVSMGHSNAESLPSGHEVETVEGKSAQGTKDSKMLSTAQAVQQARTDKFSLFELRSGSAQFDCHSRLWDWLYLTPPKWLLKHNVARTINYLRTDDALIQRDGGHQLLETQEIERVCMERGIDVLGKKEDEIRQSLAAWYSVRKVY